MQKITLNLIPDGVPPVVYVNQFDTGREFQISFKEGLSPYNFPSGVVFRINGRKADNHVFEYTESDKWDATHNIITKSGSGTSLTVTIATSEQMTAAAGDAEIQLTFKSSSASNDILGTLNFILAVQEKPDANGDPSESDLPDRVESVNGIGPDANGNVLLPPALGAIGAHNIAPVEPTRIMSTARAAGTQVYVTADDQLYDIISSIGSGGTLTPGTNAIASSISSDLSNQITVARHENNYRCQYARYLRVVQIRFTEITGGTTFSTPLPANVRPLNNLYFPLVRSDTSGINGSVMINTDGSISFNVPADGQYYYGACVYFTNG